MKTQTFFKTTRRVTSIAFMLLVMVSCSSDDDSSSTPEPTNTIYDLVENDSDYSEFVEVIDLIDFEAQLRDMSTDYTVLIPTNEAFSEFYDTTIFESDEARIEILKSILKQHIIPNDKVFYNDADEGVSTQNMNGEDLYFYLEGTTMIIDANETYATHAVETDITTDNGVIHIVAGIITE